MRVRAVRDARGEHRTTADFLLLLGASVIVAAVGVAAFWLADEYRLNSAWIFAAGSAAIFFAVVGWGSLTLS